MDRNDCAGNKNEEVADWQTQSGQSRDDRKSHLVFLFEQVADVLQLVAVHRLEVLRRVTHRNDPVLDVGEVEVELTIVVPDDDNCDDDVNEDYAILVVPDDD